MLLSETERIAVIVVTLDRDALFLDAFLLEFRYGRGLAALDFIKSAACHLAGKPISLTDAVV